MIPPNNGPIILVAFPVAESKPIAADTLSPAKSPSKRLRMGMSVAQNIPLKNDTIAIKK
jgi:hypothetical protein